MNDRIRRIVSFVAGSIVSGRHLETIIELDTGTTSQFQGEVFSDRVELIDMEEATEIAGRLSQKALFLSDSLTGTDIKLTIDENRFYGWDLTSDTPFYGKVRDNDIVLRHPGVEERFIYVV
jgi:hypothetical protein